jgi:hypothetical protein
MGLFTDDDVWNGGFYEIALEYSRDAGPSLLDGLNAVWRANTVTGCYLDCEREPDNQLRTEFAPSLPFEGHLYGVASLPVGQSVACGTCCVREDDGSDWLVFYCPMGALGRIYPVGAFPFDEHDHDPWRRELEAWLVGLARQIFNAAPFRLGLIGFEASGELRADDLPKTGVPASRPWAVLVPGPSGLLFHPRT